MSTLQHAIDRLVSDITSGKFTTAEIVVALEVLKTLREEQTPDEPAPLGELCDQPSFPHDEAYAMDTRDGVKIFGSNLQMRAHMYAYKWDVSRELAYAAISYILTQEV